MFVTEDSWNLFLGKVEINSETNCWIWQGATSRGYAKLKRNGRYFRAARWAWEAVNGPLDSDLEARHTCDNKLCVNPEHIVPGTHIDNMADMVERGRHARHSIEVCPKCSGPFTQLKDRRRCLECYRKYMENYNSLRRKAST